MLPGFFVLKLPVATMVNGSVSLAGQNGLGRWRKEATRTDLQEPERRAERPLKCPASPERTSPALLFPREGTGPCSSSLQSRERRRQLLPQPETHSKLADSSRGAQPPPRPGRGTTGPRLCAPHIQAAAWLTCRELAEADALAGTAAG